VVVLNDLSTVAVGEATNCYALTLEYDGSRFSGWQRQPGRRTVEGVLLDAVTSVTGEEVRLTAAGRTDAGAHAHGQVVGCSLRRRWEPRRLRAALNDRLPEDAVVLDVRPAPPGFHARHDARTRTYRYLVVPRSERAAVAREHAWRVPGRLDVEAMRAAAAQLVGTHDFAAFGSAPRVGGSTVRTVHSLTVSALEVPSAHGAPVATPRIMVTIDATADAFLYGMMRAIAATLVAVGRGHLDAASVAMLLDRPRTARRLPAAPAHGLHQWAVTYEDLGPGLAAAAEASGSWEDVAPGPGEEPHSG
jgi:tRNA pseudouridine38-40 synthase